jgi:phosphoglycerol transferase MdoB-like AlkP superfamily enzyme
MLLFLAGRCFFLIYHIKPVAKLPVSETLLAFIYGLTLDISFASYITILPAALLPVLLLFNISEKKIRSGLLIYSTVWIILLAFIYTLDAELFSFWGFRLDNTLFRYTGTTGEMIGSAMSSPLVILLPFYFIASYVGYKSYKKFLYPYTFSKLKIWMLPFMLLLAAALVIPIRGGLQQIPNNESVAYYSTNNLLNQAALNPAWTLARSVIEQNGPDLSRYHFFESADAEKQLAAMLRQQELEADTILTNSRPNIIIIVWESLTAKVLNDTVTPRLHALLTEGIYFSNFYASGDRSDKGLAAILSAYPAQPDFSIMTEPGKSRKLPFITQQLKAAGYQSTYLYGGELEFANMRSYMNYNGFDQVLGKSDFPKETWGAKWGAHDEATFARLFSEIETNTETAAPFFYTLFTLSSHEPYDVPVKPVITGSSKTAQFKNAHHYTDSCFFDFIQKAKKQTWWNNTWIIVVADHGHVLPGSEYATHNPSEFKIPMLWLGGAIKTHKTITKTYSQINLAPTIASYLKLNPEAFTFSAPIYLQDTTKRMAWYSYNDGFAMVQNNDTYFKYNLNSQKLETKKGLFDSKFLTQGQAFLQILMEDFYNK